jgi:hypothetical protein
VFEGDVTGISMDEWEKCNNFVDKLCIAELTYEES